MKQYDHLKKNLRNYSVDVDKEKLWQQTMHAIPKKKKRKAAPIMLLLGSFLLTGIIIYDAYQSSFEQPGRTAGSNPTLQANSIPEVQNLQSNTAETFASTENQFTPGNVNPTNSTSSQLKVSQSKQDITSKNHKADAANEVSLLKKQQLVLQNDDSSYAKRDMEMSNPELTINTEKNKPGYSAYKEINHWQTEMIASLPIDNLHDRAAKPFSIKRNAIKPAKSRPNNIFSISLLQGFGISSLSLDPGDEQASDMEGLISSSTRSLESLTTSIRGRFDLEKGISFSGGISYGQLTTETKYGFSRTNRSEGDGTSSIIIDETGQQFLVSGNVGSTKYIDLEATRYTHHQSLAFELLLHKTLFKIKHATINGYVKGGFNAWYTADGTAFTTEKVPVQFTDQTNPYRLSSPWLFGLGLDIQYRLTPKWLVSGALGYDRKDIYHEDYDQLRWKHNIYSLTLGVGYVL